MINFTTGLLAEGRTLVSFMRVSAMHFDRIYIPHIFSNNHNHFVGFPVSPSFANFRTLCFGSCSVVQFMFRVGKVWRELWWHMMVFSCGIFIINVKRRWASSKMRTKWENEDWRSKPTANLHEMLLYWILSEWEICYRNREGYFHEFLEWKSGETFYKIMLGKGWK